MERKQSRRTSFKSLPPAPRLRFWMYFSTQVDVLNSRTSFYPFATQLSRFPHPPRIPWIWNWLMTTKVVHRRTSSLVTLNEWVFVCSCLSQQEITYHRLKPLCLATFFARELCTFLIEPIFVSVTLNLEFALWSRYRTSLISFKEQFFIYWRALFSTRAARAISKQEMKKSKIVISAFLPSFSKTELKSA